jgi:hypothetical protein
LFKSPLQEAHDIFGDVEDLLERGKMELEREVANSGEMRGNVLEDEFEPFILAEKYMTTKDEHILAKKYMTTKDEQIKENDAVANSGEMRGNVLEDEFEPFILAEKYMTTKDEHILAEKYMTTKDEQIKENDAPERMQVCAS